MASELGLLHSFGRPWTGSMIELSFGRSATDFETAHSWTASEEDSPFTKAMQSGYFSRRSRRGGENLRKLLAQECVLEQLIEATTQTQGKSCTDEPVDDTYIARYLCKFLHENAGFRHSLTSLLPTYGTETAISAPPKPRNRQLRCHSSEPEISGSSRSDSKSPERKNLSLSSLCLEGNLRQPQIQPLSPRKRLSLSDSEICYAKEEETEEETSTPKDVENEKDDTAAQEENADTNITNEQPTLPVVFITEVESETTNTTSTPTDDLSSSSSSKESEVTVAEEAAASTDKPKKARKSVRFTDEQGGELVEEKMIADTSLPPLLQTVRIECKSCYCCYHHMALYAKNQALFVHWHIVICTCY